MLTYAFAARGLPPGGGLRVDWNVLAGRLGGQQTGVVDFEDLLLVPVAAAGLFILLPDQRELVEDEADRVQRSCGEVRLERFELLRRSAVPPLAVIFCGQVEVEERCVQLATDLEKRRLSSQRKGGPSKAAVHSEGFHIIGSE